MACCAGPPDRPPSPSVTSRRLQPPTHCYAGIDNSSPGNGRPRGVTPAAKVFMADIRQLVARMAQENPTWATPAFKARCRTSVITWAARPFDGSSRRLAYHPRLNVQPGGTRSSGALGHRCRGRLLHDGGVDVEWPRHLLHRVRHRSGLAARPDSRIDSPPRCHVHAPGRPSIDARGRGAAWGLRTC